MTLDSKGIEAALQEMIDKGDFYYPPDAEDVETAILAYLQATDSVVVPREPTADALARALFDIDDRRGPMREGNSVFREFYRAMIQAAEGK